MTRLHMALTMPGPGPEPEGLIRLSAEVEALLSRLQAPPRLAAHLRLVHGVAAEILDRLAHRFPTVPVDAGEVLFGAATHDVGKAVHTGELSGPGSEHEQAGYELLLGHGIDRRYARFARSHAAWTGPDAGLEDLLVSLADKVWKAKRVQDLEELVVARLAAATGEAPWEVFLALDDLLTRIAQDADRRLDFQSAHPIRSWPPMSDRP